MWVFVFQSLIIHGQAPLETQVSIKDSDDTLKEVLNQVEASTKLQFAYDGRKIDGGQRVRLNGEYTLEKLLDSVKEQLQVDYALVGNTIVLKSKPTDQREKQATIFGYIREKESGENLFGATIYDRSSQEGTVSNYYGYFSLTRPVGRAKLYVSYLGSAPQLLSVNLAKDTLVEIRQEMFSQELESVTVMSEAERLDKRLGNTVLSQQQLKDRPAIGGAVDPIKVLQLLPGVQAGNEGSAGLYVRGGGPDQNLILLDGIPVYNSSHFFGFASVFNAEAIQKVQLIKGGFPARYAGRLSSVVDMSMREGHEKEFHGSMNVGPLVGNVMIEGPIVKEKASFMVAARRSTLDWLLKPFRDDKFSFYDANLKLNYRPSKRDRIYFSSYWGRDRGELNSEELTVVREEPLQQIMDQAGTSVKWGSAISLIRWNHVWSPKLFSNVNVSHSQYDFHGHNSFLREFQGLDDEVLIDQVFSSSSDILDRGVKLELDYFPNPRHEVRVGFSALNHRFQPNVTSTQWLSSDPVRFNERSIYATEFSGYLEDAFSIGEKWDFNVGFHGVNYEIDGTTFRSLQPRLATSFALTSNFIWTASFARVTQFLHLLTNPGLGLPTDLWVPATGKVPPQNANQLTLGMQHSFPKWHVTTSLEGYFKQMTGLIEYKDGATFLRINEDWQEKVEIGEGKSYGLEWFTQLALEKLSLSAGYALAWSYREFDNINFGARFPYKYDRRHDVKFLVDYQINNKWRVALNWLYGSGIATTLPTGYFQGPGDLEDQQSSAYRPLLQFDSRNGYRLRPSHRLDLSFTYSMKRGVWDHELTIAVYNAYNRRNPLFVDARPQANFEEVDIQIQFREYSLLPVIPSISYRIQL